MRIFRRMLIGSGGLTVVCAALLAQASGPLEGTQQELKSLQSKQSGPNATKDSVGSTLPTLQIVDPSATPLETPNPRKLEKDLSKTKGAQKNWLVDGVGRLEKLEKSKSTTGAKDDAEIIASPKKDPEQTGPQSLLEVYTEQQKRTDDSKREAKSSAAPRHDPLAPFLQDWMGNSPVRGKFFDEFARGPESASSSNSVGPQVISTTNSTEVGRSGSTENSDHFRSATGGSNPYLTGLEPTASRELSPVSTPSSSAVQTSGGAGNSALILAPEPAVLDRQASDKKAPLSGPAEERKYFPQLKKF